MPDQTTDHLSGAVEGEEGRRYVSGVVKAGAEAHRKRCEQLHAPTHAESTLVILKAIEPLLATYYEDKGAEAEKLKRAELEREIRYYEHHERKAEEQLDLAGVEKIDNEERSDSTDDSAGQPWSIWMRIKFLRRQVASAKGDGRREGEDKGRSEERERLRTVADDLRRAGLENQRLYNAGKTSDPHLRGQYVGMHHAYTGAAVRVLASLDSDQEAGNG